MIFDSLAKFGNKIALHSSLRNWTFKEVVSKSDDICTNIQSGSIVLLFCDNNIETICAYIGFLRKRIIPILINSKTDTDSVNEILKRFKPNYLFKCDDTFEMNGYKGFVETSEYKLLKSYNTDAVINNENLALLLTTSGSTGSPKFVKISYENLVSNTNSINEYLNIIDSDTGITCLPIFYSFGLSILNTHLFSGGSIVVTDDSYLSRSFWDLIKKHKVTTFSGVPYSFSILQRLNLDNFDLSSIKYVTQAGGKLDKKLVSFWEQYFREKGIKFYVMYGQTEATARMSYVPYEDLKNKPGSIGIPIPDGAFSIYHEDGNGENDNFVGELVYHGKNVCLGYAEKLSDLLDGDVNGGKLFTGDLAYKDKDGYYYIAGRKKRFLKLYGNRINLDELELKLKEIGLECLCAGIDDNLRIFIIKSNLEDSIDEYIMNHTLINPNSYKVVQIDQFPISDSGKVLYSELK